MSFPGDCSPRRQPVPITRSYRIRRLTRWVTDALRHCWLSRAQSHTISYSNLCRTIPWVIINQLPKFLSPLTPPTCIRAPTLSRRSKWLRFTNHNPSGLMDVFLLFLLLHRQGDGTKCSFFCRFATKRHWWDSEQFVSFRPELKEMASELDVLWQFCSQLWVWVDTMWLSLPYQGNSKLCHWF